MKYEPITQGEILTGWHLMFLVSKYDLIDASIALKIVKSSGKFGGLVPAKPALNICFNYGLLNINGGKLVLTEIATKSIIPCCAYEDANALVLRAILAHIINHHHFDWLIFYDPDPNIFFSYLEIQVPEWANLLNSAGLFNFDDLEINKWWEQILFKYEDYKEKLKKAIGDVGEKLTYHYELKRIENDGKLPAKHYVKWASNFSNHFGYDILSIRSKLLKSGYDEFDKIQLEVKSTDANNIKNYRFFISKNEWKTAILHISSYYFVCWAGIDLTKETSKSGPYLVPVESIIHLIPIDQSVEAEWTECRIIIDLEKYSSYLP